MPTTLDGRQPSEALMPLIVESINRYEEILALFELINGSLGGNDPQTLHTRGLEIVQLQETAARADRALTASLKVEDLAPALIPLLERRYTLMQQSLTHNRTLLATATNIKSLLAHEIKKMQGGRAALNGYRQTTVSANGGLLSSSF